MFWPLKLNSKLAGVSEDSKFPLLGVWVSSSHLPQSGGCDIWPLYLPSKNSRIHQDSNSQSGNSLKSVGVHSFTFSYTPGSMKCDSWASPLARTFVSPCFGREPKARVVTYFALLNFVNFLLYIWETIINQCDYLNFFIILWVSYYCTWFNLL